MEALSKGVPELFETRKLNLPGATFADGVPAGSISPLICTAETFLLPSENAIEPGDRDWETIQVHL